MNRREFFQLRSRGRSILELSCETLYMRYLDSQMDGTKKRFLESTREEFRQSSKVRLRDAYWLDRGDFGSDLEPLLQEFRARGGSIEYA